MTRDDQGCLRCSGWALTFSFQTFMTQIRLGSLRRTGPQGATLRTHSLFSAVVCSAIVSLRDGFLLPGSGSEDGASDSEHNA